MNTVAYRFDGSGILNVDIELLKYK